MVTATTATTVETGTGDVFDIDTASHNETTPETLDCTHPECSADSEHMLIFGADVEGMLADWANVGFCSSKCLHSFVMQYDRARPVEDPRVQIYWNDTFHVRMTRGDDGIVNEAFTCGEHNIAETITRVFTEQTETPTPGTTVKTVVNGTFACSETTVSDDETLEDAVERVLDNTDTDRDNLHAHVDIGEWKLIVNRIA